MKPDARREVWMSVFGAYYVWLRAERGSPTSDGLAAAAANVATQAVGGFDTLTMRDSRAVPLLQETARQAVESLQADEGDEPCTAEAVTAKERADAARDAMHHIEKAQTLLGSISQGEDDHLLQNAADGLDSASGYLSTYARRWGDR